MRMIRFLSLSFFLSGCCRINLNLSDRACTHPFILCKNFALVVSSFFAACMKQEKKRIERQKKCNCMSTSNCAFINGQQPKYFVEAKRQFHAYVALHPLHTRCTVHVRLNLLVKSSEICFMSSS